jgi:hypothetical protein
MDWFILVCLLVLAVVCSLIFIGRVMAPQLSGPGTVSMITGMWAYEWGGKP